MPGINFEQIREAISMEQVLNLIGFTQTTRSGDQLHGPCPVHQSQSPGSRSFSVNLSRSRYYCHKCRSHGNQIELWADVKKLPIYPGAIDLCRCAGIEIPWVNRW